MDTKTSHPSLSQHGAVIETRYLGPTNYRGKDHDCVFDSATTAEEVRQSLIEHDGYDPRITVEPYRPPEEPASVLPRWTLAPGRLLCYDGRPVVFLGVAEDPKTAKRSCAPYAADDLANLLIALLEVGAECAPGDAGGPYTFPLRDEVVELARAATRGCDHESMQEASRA
jgi:hypothetical protein